ncbi:MAG: UDP-N-acetylmuramoylalanyl-D-glutamate--2,6-diaminopimelate ligase [Ignavibacteria bacterium]|nr:UDP-N-acetylmuramoylalanyl-D-glutamate--2,6-diaminopimelate ligase [Ignavibacteria bacterium]
MKTLAEILNNINYKECFGDLNIPISSIAFDSRKVVTNSLFIAVRGAEADGHGYINKAAAQGATAITCEEIPENANNLTIVRVENSRLALALAAHNYFDNPTNNLNIIGITGTNGKTTITYLLKSIYEAAGKQFGFIGTTGANLGERRLPTINTTPDPLSLCSFFSEALSYGITDIAMEVSSHALSQNRIDAIRFSAIAFTNLTHDHLDYHHTIDNYAKAKKLLFEFADEQTVAIINGDDDYGDFMLRGCLSAIQLKLGRKSKNDIIIKNEKVDFSGIRFQLVLPDKRNIEIITPLIGRFNIDNAAMAAALAINQGISEEFVIEGLSKSSGAPGRMQTHKLQNGAVAVIDYAHTPDALLKALTTCREILEPQNRLLCVFGCGGNRDAMKRPVMGKISASIADLSIITSDNPRNEEPEQIIEQILNGIPESSLSNVLCIPDRKDAIGYAYMNSKKGDIILIAGKGHETYQIIGAERLHFDDAETVLQWSMSNG